MNYKPLKIKFYDRDALDVAKDLIGKCLCTHYKNTWLTAKIIETEAYKIEDKGSHASLGFTEKRKALFMPPGTIYMYYSRGKDSMNISVKGDGAAVLIKSAIPHIDENSNSNMLTLMHQLNPSTNGETRSLEKLCSGQTLLCKALNIKLTDWDQQQFDHNKFYIADINYQPEKIIQTTRLGIPEGRDEHLPYRFVDYLFATSATQNPLTKRIKNFIII